MIDKVKFDENGLVPVVVQDHETGEVLMLGYMDEEALKKTTETGLVHFHSRSRGKLWMKGETSGNLQNVKELWLDCDGDSLLVKVEQAGVTCHTGNRTCFYREYANEDFVPREEKSPDALVLEDVFSVIEDRKKNPREDSYTSSLMKKGRESILKKIGEEAFEVMLGSMADDRDNINWEVADLWYHTLVLLSYHDTSIREIFKDLDRRRK